MAKLRMKLALFLLILLLGMGAGDGAFVGATQAKQIVPGVQVWETFDSAEGCATEPFAHPLESDVHLNWAHGEASSMAGQQRADALGGEACSAWLNGADFDNATSLVGGVEIDFSVEIVRGEDRLSSGLQLDAKITPTSNLSNSVGVRWFITLDNAPLGEREVDNLVLHFGWSSAFHHDEGNVTNWSEFIDEERLELDGIPISDDDLWRVEVALIVMDDLNHSILAASNVKLESPTLIPGRSVALPVIFAVVGVASLFALVIRGEKRREEGLPRLSGTLTKETKGWVVKATFSAGNRDVTLKGASAEQPWRIGRVASEQLIPSETVRTFTATMRCPDEELAGAVTHWEIDVDELGGWVLDLKLPLPSVDGDREG